MFNYFGPSGAENENPKVAVVDVYAVNNLLDVSFEQFGFDEATKGIPCFIRSAPGATNGTVCDDADRRTFWDDREWSQSIWSGVRAEADLDFGWSI